MLDAPIEAARGLAAKVTARVPSKVVRRVGAELFRRCPQNRAVFEAIQELRAQSLVYICAASGVEIPECEVLSRVDRGDIVLVRNLIGALELTEQFERLSQEYFGAALADLKDVHRHQSVEQLVTQAKRAKNSEVCLSLQASVMARLLAPHSSKYYLELNPNIRLHLPYQYVRKYEAYVEAQLGRGKLNPHGQHKDSWRGHPLNTINVWIALTDATPDNGLAILPNSTAYMPKYGKSEMAPEARSYPAQQFVTRLKAGDALLFRAELLHGSIINHSRTTRVVLSARCTVTKPRFHRDFRYNYIGIENGAFNNLTLEKHLRSHNFVPPSRDVAFAPAESKGTMLEPLSIADDHSLVRRSGQTLRFPRTCPHNSADLLNGEFDEDDRLLCPSHRMRIVGTVVEQGK